MAIRSLSFAFSSKPFQMPENVSLLPSTFGFAACLLARSREVSGVMEAKINVFLLISHRQWRKSHINPRLISLGAPLARFNGAAPTPPKKIRIIRLAGEEPWDFYLTKSINFNSCKNTFFRGFASRTSIRFAFWLWTRRQLGLFYCLSRAALFFFLLLRRRVLGELNCIVW